MTVEFIYEYPRSYAPDGTGMKSLLLYKNFKWNTVVDNKFSKRPPDFEVWCTTVLFGMQEQSESTVGNFVAVR